ncbi:hypothetical protein PIB30_072039 [Stylosanthes scabra]|uniref:Uncharacterized protein n=1 Tax=Stylosanthes scabra TaxID=79078 RepID=A0ABU6TPQ0_9FABA|nr:hypothetical protein [Stylosanthes scabra]
MPLSLMKKLGIKEMKPTKVILQMADKSVRHAHGIVENVLMVDTRNSFYRGEARRYVIGVAASYLVVPNLSSKPKVSILVVLTLCALMDHDDFASNLRMG